MYVMCVPCDLRMTKSVPIQVIYRAVIASSIMLILIWLVNRTALFKIGECCISFCLLLFYHELL